MVISPKNEQPAAALAQDDDTRLFLAALEKTPAQITLSGAEAPLEVTLYGELLLRGVLHDQRLSLTKVERISFWTDPIDALQGPATFGGPVEPGVFESDPTQSSYHLSGLRLRLVYKELLQSGIDYEDEDAVFPRLEALRGNLTISPAWKEDPDDPDKGYPVIRLGSIFSEISLGYIGLVRGLAVNTELRVRPLVQTADTALSHHSLAPFISFSSGNGHQAMSLNLRFIDLSNSYSIPSGGSNAALDDIAQAQINGAGQVWCAKGGICINPIDAHVLPPAASATVSGVIPFGQESDLLVVTPLPDLPTEKAVAIVFLVDNLPGDGSHPRRGGGVSYNCGTSNAFVILNISKAQNNIFLLAHELGHVLGLTHPFYLNNDAGNQPTNAKVGSDCSIMLPERPCSPRNTSCNLTLPAMPLGSILTQYPSAANPQSCAWREDTPQGYYHIVRDFAYDDGDDPLRGAAAADPYTVRPGSDVWWAASDVWNSNLAPRALPNPDEKYSSGAEMIHPDHTPVSSDPTSGGTNYLCVRLHSGQKLTTPPPGSVNVRVFMGNPGNYSQALQEILITNPAENLTFDFGDVLPGAPATKAISWIIPAGFPPHSCVFAVASSTLDPDPMPPGGYTFADLANRVRTDNDVAQRNVTIPVGANGLSVWAMPWMMVGNYRRQAARAELLVEFPDESFLKTLQLEVDEVPKITIHRENKHVPICLWKTLAPDSPHILRMTATVAGSTLEGQTTPVDLILYLNGEIAGGYTYRLRIGSLEEAAEQVFDQLFHALDTLRHAYPSAFSHSMARDLLDQVRELAVQAAEAPYRSLERLADLAQNFEALNFKLGTRTSPSRKIGKRLAELAGLLSAYSYSREHNDAQMLEEIRSKADRIQEPASRVAQRRLYPGPIPSPGQKDTH